MKTMICMAMALLFLVCPVEALQENGSITTSETMDGLESLIPEQAQEYLADVDTSDMLHFGDSLKSIAEAAFGDGIAAVKHALSGILRIFLIAAVCSLTAGLYAGSRFDVVTLCGSAAILACAVGDLSSMGAIAKDAVESMNVFSKALLPALTAASAASGAVTAASVRHTAMLFLTDVVITGIHALLLPMTYAYIAISAANTVGGNDALAKIGELCKNAVSSILRIGLTLYTTILGLSGVISGSVDAITSRTVRLTVSSAIPVVGGIVADVSETVLAGAKIAKNTIGVFGILVILASVLMPVVVIGVMYLTYKIAAALSAVCVKGEIIRLIDAIGTGFGLLFGMTGACAVLLLVTIISSIIGGGSA